MRSLALLLLVPLALTFASADHAPRPECHPDPSLPATGVVQFSLDGDSYYVVDDHDGDAAGPHVYEETNGIAPPGDLAHALQRADGHEDDLHPDLPPGCQDPLVAPDRHVW